MKTDTIAAIATGMTNSGIGIVRVSGPEAVLIVNKIYFSKQSNDENLTSQRKLIDFKSHTIHYGFIYDNDFLVDEVMVSVMKAPHSFTMEDTVEINCHGGILVMNRILETVIKNGARVAEAGEFTKRAFLNGRIDLSKAEAIIDIIHSKSEYALQSSVMQLKGSISEIVKKMRSEIIYEIAFIESALDDPEHISLDGYPENLSIKINSLLTEIETLIQSSKNGKMLKEGINTVILGKPNAGKSSLLNILVGEERAIVTNVAGTTRDILEETITLHGIVLNMIDTAGIRNTEDVVEKIGVERAKKYAIDADLILYVVDSSVPLDESDEDILTLIKDKNTIVLLNKSDLEQVVADKLLAEKLASTNVKIIKTSAKENIGIDKFENTIKDMFFEGNISFNDDIYITNMRHKEALMDTRDSLFMVRKSLEDNMPEDFYSIDLMSAYASLGYIVGEEVSEDLVNEIFSKFCMGK